MKLLKALLLFECISSALSVWSYTLESALKTELYTTNSYDVGIRPEKKTRITISFGIFSLNELNIVSQSMSVAGYFQLKWLDPRLDWSANPTYSTDVTSFFSKDSETWIPGIIIMNSVNGLSVWDPNDMPLRVVQSGQVVWNHVGTFVTACESDVTYYPFDSQSCDIQLTTWAFTTNEIELSWSTSEDSLSTDFYSENGEWNFLEYSTDSSSVQRGPETYNILKMTLKFKRRPLFQVVNTVLPCLCLAFLGCVVFKLPNDTGEKIGFVLTVLLAYTVYLTLVSANMPTTSIHVSVFSIYLLITMIFGILSVLLTILILIYHHKPDDQEVPKLIRRFVRMYSSCSSKKCCMPSNDIEDIAIKVKTKDNKEKYSKDNGKQVEEEDPEEKLTWRDVSEILNEFFYRVFLIATVIYQVVFMAIFVLGFVIE